MTIVSDSTALIGLSRVGRADLLPALFGRVLVPPAVIEEVFRAGKRYPNTATLLRAAWIERAPAAPPLPQVPHPLGAGEREGLALAHARGLPLLTDDRPARTFAETLGVPIIRTLGVLLRAEEQGLVPDALPVVDELIATGFRLHPRVVEEFKSLLAASRRRRADSLRAA